MTDFRNQQALDFAEKNGASANEPNAFRDIAADIWSAPTGKFDQSAGNGLIERAAFHGGRGGNGGGGNGPIPELDGIKTTLDQLPSDADKTEVTVDAKVKQVLPDFSNPRNGLTHEQFIIELADGNDIFVAHDLNFAPRVPVQAGQDIELKGEWIPKPEHENHGGTETVGVLHWTHHSEDENHHPSGYIQYKGQVYQ